MAAGCTRAGRHGIETQGAPTSPASVPPAFPPVPLILLPPHGQPLLLKILVVTLMLEKVPYFTLQHRWRGGSLEDTHITAINNPIPFEKAEERSL